MKVNTGKRSNGTDKSISISAANRAFVLSMILLPGLLGEIAPEWQQVASPTTAGLRGLSAVSDQVIWASGTAGTILRTIDGGGHWLSFTVPDATALDFRDIEASDANNAVALSSGTGAKSTVYLTRDGGIHWQRTLENPDADGFFDALAFLSREHGFLIGDPVAGAFALYETTDGGASWQRMPGPKALENEGLFAASGTCLIASPGTRDLWFGTGGGELARVLHSMDAGHTWTAATVPLKAHAKTAGIFSLALSGKGKLLAVGGDYAHPDDASGTAALSNDRGNTWEIAPGLSGYRSGGAFLPSRSDAIYAVGSNGSDIIGSNGKWLRFSSLNLNAIAFTPSGVVWAAGPRGALAHMKPQ